MTQLLKVTMTILVISFLSACSTIEVSQDFNEKADFSQYKTFEWFPADKQTKPTAEEFERKNPLIAARITSAIESELQKKGLALKESGADAYITYHISSLQKVRSNNFTTSIGYGTGFGYGGFGGIAFQTSPEVQQYEEGQLFVDILDKEGKLLWRGKSTTPLQEHPQPEETTELINEAIQKLLAQYPPKK